MPRMSVSMTLPSVRAGVKDVTRRRADTWKRLAEGDQLTLIEKGMGLPKGAKQVVVCEVEVVSVRLEALSLVTYDEVRREGLLDQALAERGELSVAAWFQQFWMRGHGYNPETTYACDVQVRRIEWRYRLAELPGGSTCLAHLQREPCSTCAAYIAAGL